MSSIQDRVTSFSFTSLKGTAFNGLAYIHATYGDAGVQRLKTSANELDVACACKCPLAVGSNSNYHVAKKDRGLKAEDCERFGFMPAFGVDAFAMNRAWREVARAL